MSRLETTGPAGSGSSKTAVTGQLRAVLWDMDGTLVDTEPYWIAAEYRLVESFGGTWSDEHAHALVGNPLLVSAEYIRAHGPVPLEPAAIVDQMLDWVIADVGRHIDWRPGVRRLLAEIRAADLPNAMVTMSYANLAGAVAKELPAGTFRTLVTGDLVLAGKPDPECYLLAAERLGLEPGSCLAIEDSPSGVAAAQAAGCVVVAVPNQVALTPDHPRTVVLPNLAEVDLAELVTVYERLAAVPA